MWTRPITILLVKLAYWSITLRPQMLLEMGRYSEINHNKEIQHADAKHYKKFLIVRWGVQVTLVLLAFPIILFLAENVVSIHRGAGRSMEPTLQADDRYLVENIMFRLGIRLLQPGDIITFRVPESPSFPTGSAVKRLIAIGGQHVRIKNCYVYVNGQPLTDNAFNHPGHPNPKRQCYYSTTAGIFNSPDAEVLVPPGHYFVLGDNSAVSMDSRFVGFIKQEDVTGRVYLRIWPPWRFGVP